MNTLPIDTKVIGIGSQTATYFGRTGEIVEIDEVAGRYRVRWILEANGKTPVNRKNPPTGTRTWVKYQCVKKVEAN